MLCAGLSQEVLSGEDLPLLRRDPQMPDFKLKDSDRGLGSSTSLPGLRNGFPLGLLSWPGIAPKSAAGPGITLSRAANTAADLRLEFYKPQPPK